MTAALDAFRKQLRDSYGGTGDEPVKGGPPEMALAGYTMYEAPINGYPVRGYARDDGTVLCYARQNWDAVLDAAEFASEPPGLGTREVVDRILWLFGPRFELVKLIDASELGLEDDATFPLERIHISDDRVELRFGVREREDGRTIEARYYTVAGGRHRPFRFSVFTVEPQAEE